MVELLFWRLSLLTRSICDFVCEESDFACLFIQGPFSLQGTGELYNITPCVAVCPFSVLKERD
uniref:Uncharacterized protein n=1 Tax=Anguilla anguilla TaxID=7936 RepID=A0A0E9PWI4_ANGAN